MRTAAVLVLERWFEEVWNQRKVETIDDLLTPESVCHSDQGPIVGVTGFRERMYEPFLAAFPDLKVTVVDTLCEGPNVVLRWTARGTHSGDGLGIPPTGRTVEFQGITWACIRDGKMIEGWERSNAEAVVRALRDAA